MARHVFFSFHYKDVVDFRANVVRNAWLTKDKESVFYDKSIWEESQLKGVAALKKLIEDGLHHTSITTVLIGSNTFERPWVKYEIFKSFEDGNGLFGIYINKIKCKNGNILPRGPNPFDYLGVKVAIDGKTIDFYEYVDSKWQIFKKLPQISNKRSNTVYFSSGILSTAWGKFYKLSQLFPTYCWVDNSGYDNFTRWVENAYLQRGYEK
ncbi:TIR domain-containing protein [Xanthocytophaga agilis]|uniref:TIR domain-containing protein n=1 Tax=Xanthocytophaga agilis TaxID=3048010 RepID=A0AAE3UGX5_9BACT|nr:TIR domain-containing protein [Xanthocytophaga agilis]MDJ1502053.1 TIR domain-containing protein [Xanthocytophaga agilis]